MSLAGRIGKAVLKRIEASPRVQAQMASLERTGPVILAARNAAYSACDDEAAKAKLCDRIQVGPQLVDEALSNFDHRADYIADRAYRLLAAVAAGTVVAPIPQEQAELFGQEEAIGRAPIERAFEQLAAIEPGLLDAKRRAETIQREADPSGRGLPTPVREQLGQLVGGGARSDHQLLHSTLATSVVHQYLAILVGNSRLGTPDVAYFDNPIKQFVASGVLLDLRRGRPRH